jgi:hypothetical protein
LKLHPIARSFAESPLRLSATQIDPLAADQMDSALTPSQTAGEYIPFRLTIYFVPKPARQVVREVEGTTVGLIESIEAEVGPLSKAERQLAERELDLLAAFAAGLVGRLPTDATKEEQLEVITELLHEDAELSAVFSQLMAVNGSSRGSPMRSVSRLEQELKSAGGAP